MLGYQFKACYFLRFFIEFQFSAFGRQTSMDALVGSDTRVSETRLFEKAGFLASHRQQTFVVG
jgi:hypothetical protein